jgi:hypothetical protein
MAPDGADIEQHWPVFALCGFEGFGAPLEPANGLVHGGT